MALDYELIQQMAIIMVIAYLFSKSPLMHYFSGGPLRGKDKLVLFCVFSLFAMTGTYVGMSIHGAIANTRAIDAEGAGFRSADAT